MGNLRCPVCDRLNKDDAIACEFCGARLDPVRGKLGRLEGLGKPAQPPSPPASGGAGALPLPEWLGSIGEESSDQAQPGEGDGTSDELPDWLGDLEDRLDAAKEVPEAASPSGQLPDWFGRLAQTTAADTKTPEAIEPEPQPPYRGTPKGEESKVAPEPEGLEPAGGMPAWLQRLRQKQAASQQEPAAEQSAEGTGESALRRALFREFPSEPPDKESPDAYDWLERLRARKEEEEALPPQQPTAPEPEAGAPEPSPY